MTTGYEQPGDPNFEGGAAFERYQEELSKEKILQAEDRGSRYLADANEALERGDKPRAEKLFAKGQYWLDRYNKLAGNA